MTERRTSRFRASLAGRAGPALGTWVKLPVIESVELIAFAGFDFLVIDLEHSSIDLETTYRLIGMSLAQGVSPLVRVPNVHNGYVQRVLDAGADGIMVPHVDSAAEARAVVDACRFPPRGSRGASLSGRAGLWGAGDLTEYLRFGTEEVMVIAQIETAAAAASAGDIARVEGIDALVVGELDLSVSEGTAPGDPAIASLAAAVLAAGHSARVPVGNAGGGSESALRHAVDSGFDFTLQNTDVGLLGAAARSLVTAARELSRP